MKLQVFNGGKVTRLAPNLLGAAEGVVFSNINTERAVLEPVNKHSDVLLAESKYAHYFSAKNKWVSSDIDRDYVEYQEKLYYTEVGSIPKVYDGTNTYLLGIKEPLNTLALADGGAGVLTGTYTYVYTYYNVNTGIESNTSYLAEITIAAKQVDISGITASTDSQVSHIRLYRVGGALTKFALVTTLDKSATVYTDNIADTAIDGRLLETESYYQAKSGAKYLVEAYAMLFYALADKLYFTPPGKPWAWPEEYFIDFPLAITGIGVTTNGLIVFTLTNCYIVTGTTPETLSRFQLSSKIGCKSHKSIAELNSKLIWVSDEGFCISNGSTPQVVSRYALGDINIDPVASAVHRSVYYLQHTTGLIAYDTRYNKLFKDFDLDISYLVIGNSKLYGYFTEGYYELFTGADKEEFHYVSPVFTEGAYTNRKNYKSIYVYSEGDIKVKLYIDKVLVNEWDLTGIDTHELKIVQEKKNDYSLQLDLSGTGTVYEIEFSPYGRTN